MLSFNHNNIAKQVDEPDHVYLDGTFYNDSYRNPSDPVQYVPAIISQQRSSPFINDPSKYNLTIARFSISSDYIARVYQSIGTTGTHTKDRLWVSLSYNSTYNDVPIIIPTTTDPVGFPQKADYNIFNFLNIINQGFLTSQNAVTTAGGPTGPGQVLMTFDPASALYSINIPSWYGTGTVGTTGNGVGVHMSYFLNNKFQSFDVIQNSPLLYNDHDITFNRVWRGDNLVDNLYTNVGLSGTGTTGVYMVQTQDGSWASTTTDDSRLVLVTSTLPIVSEYKSTTNYSHYGGSNGSQSLQIVTDFLIGKDAQLNSRGQSYIYLPNLYRLTELKGSTPITQWDIQAFVSDNQGFLYPLYLSPAGSFDIKLLFIKKGLSN
jgi:hypothetical protein